MHLKIAAGTVTMSFALWIAAPEASLGNATSIARCSQMMIIPDTNDVNINILKLRGTRDSVSDGRYYAGKWDLQRDSVASFTPPFDVYGQVFTVNALAGPRRNQLKDHRKVVLIWWSVTPACSRDRPYRAVQRPDTNIVLSVSPRKREEWINGLPTFDVPNATFLYVNGKSMFDR